MRGVQNMNSIHNPERLLTRSEVEDLFGLSVRFLEVSATRGDGPVMIRVGRLVRYRIRDIHDWIEERSTRNSTGARGQ